MCFSSPTVTARAWHYTLHRSRHRNLDYSLWICLRPQLNAPPNSVPVVSFCSLVVVFSPIRTVHNLSQLLELASLPTHVTHLALHAYLSLSCPHPGSCTITNRSRSLSLAAFIHYYRVVLRFRSTCFTTHFVRYARACCRLSPFPVPRGQSTCTHSLYPPVWSRIFAFDVRPFFSFSILRCTFAPVRRCAIIIDGCGRGYLDSTHCYSREPAFSVTTPSPLRRRRLCDEPVAHTVCADCLETCLTSSSVEVPRNAQNNPHIPDDHIKSVPGPTGVRALLVPPSSERKDRLMLGVRLSALLVGAAAVAAAPAGKTGFKLLVVFGDSLSDNVRAHESAIGGCLREWMSLMSLNRAMEPGS